jgi:hypothetical protein
LPPPRVREEEGATGYDVGGISSIPMPIPANKGLAPPFGCVVSAIQSGSPPDGRMSSSIHTMPSAENLSRSSQGHFQPTEYVFPSYMPSSELNPPRQRTPPTPPARTHARQLPPTVAHARELPRRRCKHGGPELPRSRLDRVRAPRRVDDVLRAPDAACDDGRGLAGHADAWEYVARLRARDRVRGWVWERGWGGAERGDGALGEAGAK